jgi:hypothetical protein
VARTYPTEARGVHVSSEISPWSSSIAASIARFGLGSARGRMRPSSKGDRDRLSRLDLLSRSDLLSSAADETAVEREGGTGDAEHMRSGDAEPDEADSLLDGRLGSFDLGGDSIDEGDAIREPSAPESAPSAAAS